MSVFMSNTFLFSSGWCKGEERSLIIMLREDATEEGRWFLKGMSDTDVFSSILLSDEDFVIINPSFSSKFPSSTSYQ